MKTLQRDVPSLHRLQLTKKVLPMVGSSCISNRCWSSPTRVRRRALTLTEVMVAVAVTLVLLGVLISMFRFASGEIAKGRAIIELSGQLRLTSERLRNDLDGLTVPTRPWTDNTGGLGYFEYFEGAPHRDDPSAPDTTHGDVDDVLMFTARAKDRPFRGRFWVPGATQPTIIESNWAEVIWWTVLEDTNLNGQLDTGEQLLLRRRVLLIRPDLNLAGTGNLWPDNDLKSFYETNDISVRATATGLAANSLADLSRRENRFAHSIGYAYPLFPANDSATVVNGLAAAFPYPIDRDWLNGLVLTGNYQGEDVVLSSLVGMDVKIYDETVPIYDNRTTAQLGPAAVGNIALGPSDPGYVNELAADLVANAVIDANVGTGGYVDIGYESLYLDPVIPGLLTGVINSQFSGPPASGSRLGQLAYSTWPASYEADGLDQDNDSLIDEGTNGRDDDGIGGADTVSERETSPPYPFKVRGVQVVIRVLEPDTQQVRQVTVVQDFLPE